jgi:hypothetical protein
MGTHFFKTTRQNVQRMWTRKAGARELFARLAYGLCPLLLGSVIAFADAYAPELQLSNLDKPTTLAAVVRSDNGKLVGMQATLGRSYLKYKAFEGQLNLKLAGKFDAAKLPGGRARFFARQMNAAAVYSVENAEEFLTKNKGRLFISPGQKPTFITIKSDKYADGKNAIWICVLSAQSMPEFYRTSLGHERCDAFR